MKGEKNGCVCVHLWWKLPTGIGPVESQPPASDPTYSSHLHSALHSPRYIACIYSAELAVLIIQFTVLGKLQITEYMLQNVFCNVFRNVTQSSVFWIL